MKPENMLLNHNNEVVLSDFGIAVVAHSTKSMRIEDIIGTSHYMAPEQLSGQPRTASDQYSLAVIVYSWLTGTFPFTGTYVEIVSQQLTKLPPLMRNIIPNLPVEVEQVVLKALGKTPEQRYASIRAFAQALEQASSLISNAPKQPAPSPKQAFLLAGPAPTIPPIPPTISATQVAASILSPVDNTLVGPPTVSTQPALLSTPQTKWNPIEPSLALVAAYSISWIIFVIIMIIVGNNIYGWNDPPGIYGIVLPFSIVLFFSWGWIMAQKTGKANAGSIPRSIGIAAITIFGGPIYWGIAIYQQSAPGGYAPFAFGNAIEGVIVGILIALGILPFAFLIGFGATFLGGLIGKRLSQFR